MDWGCYPRFKISNSIHFNLSGILKDRTMDDKLIIIYIPNHDVQNHPFCRLKLLFPKFYCPMSHNYLPCKFFIILNISVLVTLNKKHKNLYNSSVIVVLFYFYYSIIWMIRSIKTKFKKMCTMSYLVIFNVL